MELKYLTTFKTILETGSFQKAAERLNYAQSTINLQDSFRNCLSSCLKKSDGGWS